MTGESSSAGDDANRSRRMVIRREQAGFIPELVCGVMGDKEASKKVHEEIHKLL